MRKINLGCGPVFVDAPDWLNLDFVPCSPSVRQANLLETLPLADHSASMVYSSHFLEHVPRNLVPGLLRECWRVLQPGGIVRLVVPDLENMVREYLSMREAGEHEKADFVVLEIIDQCVRRDSGGELARLYRHVTSHADHSTAPMIEYIRERTGENLCSSVDAGRRVRNLRSLSTSMRSRIERSWINFCLRALPAAFRAQNVSLSTVGENHHWLWDFHQLKTALEAAGFVDVQRCSANSSVVADFPVHPLDVDAQGLPRKGAESIYLEARKLA